MLQGRNFIRDIMCLALLIGLVQYNFKTQYLKNLSNSTIAIHVAQQGFEKITDTVSDTFSKIGKATRRKKRDTTHLPKEAIAFVDHADTVLQQLENTRTKIERDDSIDGMTKDAFFKDIKDVRTQVLHVRKEFIKDPKDARFLTGPLGPTARVVHERSLHKKLLESVNKTGSILLFLSNELNGQEKKLDPATSVEQGLNVNNRILLS
jgi:hypothetical protein